MNKFIHLFFLLICSTVLFSACSKSDNTPSEIKPEPPTPAVEKDALITLQNTEAGNKIRLTLEFDEKDNKDIYIDYGTGNFELIYEAVDLISETNESVGIITETKGKTIRIKGNVIDLRVSPYAGAPSNSITSIDVSQNPLLEELDIRNLDITQLNLNNNKNLKGLYCINNKLTALNLSNNKALEALSCENNQLTELSLSQNTKLITLTVNKNKLSALDISGCKELEFLNAYNNNLTALNISENSKLHSLVVFNNQVSNLTLPNTFPSLENVAISNNKLNEQQMGALINTLPVMKPANFYGIRTNLQTEGNVITKQQVAVLTSKGWWVFNMIDDNTPEGIYSGS